jgi:hypothetical protein
VSIEYRLVLAGSTPVDQVAARAFPAAAERPTGVPPLLSADLDGRYGFHVDISAGRHGYFDASSDDGPWEWEPDDYVAIDFTVDKFADRERAVTEMIAAVRRVVTSGPEDAVFTFNGDLLLFTRLSGETVQHRRDSWWTHHPAAEQLIASVE